MQKQNIGEWKADRQVALTQQTRGKFNPKLVVKETKGPTNYFLRTLKRLGN